MAKDNLVPDECIIFWHIPGSGRWIGAYWLDRKSIIFDVTSQEACVAAMRLLTGAAAKALKRE